MQILDCLWTVSNATIKIVLVQKQFNVAQICCEPYVTVFEAWSKTVKSRAMKTYSIHQQVTPRNGSSQQNGSEEFDRQWSWDLRAELAESVWNRITTQGCLPQGHHTAAKERFLPITRPCSFLAACVSWLLSLHFQVYHFLTFGKHTASCPASASQIICWHYVTLGPLGYTAWCDRPNIQVDSTSWRYLMYLHGN
jgi:hypothetical protein